MTHTNNHTEATVSTSSIRSRLWLNPVTSDFLSDANQYDEDDYIDDRMTDYASESIHVYNCDLYKSITDHPDYAERALDEFGWEGCGKSLSGVGEMTEYLLYLDHLIEDRKGIVISLILDKLEERGIKEVSKDFNEEVETDDFRTFDDISHWADDYASSSLTGRTSAV